MQCIPDVYGDNMYKHAFFLDIDGTYLDTEGKVLEENVRVINKLVEEGHYVFICTGRPLSNIGEYIIKSANWSGIISSLGAVITVGDTMIKEICVPWEFAERVAEVLIREKRWFCLGNYEMSLAYLMRVDKDKWLNLTSLEEIKKHKRRISKLDMDVGLSEELVELISEEMTLYTYDTYSEAGIKGVSKASAIEYVLETLGIKRENSVAVGDSENDLEMIEFAGIGVAMANAPENVREKADVVTDTNNNAGVAKALCKFLSEK